CRPISADVKALRRTPDAMTDDGYPLDPAQAPPSQHSPEELLFEFVRESDQARFRCELRDDGDYGVDAWVFQNESLYIAWRHPTREHAIAWAEAERQKLADSSTLDLAQPS